MVTVTLVYPYFRPSKDNSIFRFPPLGLGYVAAYLKGHGVSVDLVDCTFLSQEEALRKIRRSNPKMIGIQAMFSMKDKALEMAELLKHDCEMLVAGGPLPSQDPRKFLKHFNVVVVGEGELAMLELVDVVEGGTSLSNIKGIVFIEKEGKEVITTEPREFVENLNDLPFPSREMFDNQSYRNYYKKRFGYTTTSIMTSRGCPFKCDFCSRPVFGNDFRSRSARNIADEVEDVSELGYERVWFADDCFTLNRSHLIDVCNELVRRQLNVGWECLSRVDTVDAEVAEKMKEAGCLRVFFGIESGNDSVLAIMNKQATTKQAEKAVHTFKKTGIQVGAFFIVGYPGESEKTVLDTVNFASSLPLDYLSFTLPYPIPGTPLFERVENEMILDDWQEPRNFHLIKHKLLFRSAFSEAKLKLAIVKGMTQHYMKKYFEEKTFGMISKPYELLTDVLYKIIP